MTQELIDLRISIIEGRYADALTIVDELEGMSKKAILHNIESFLVRLLVHLIKNQIELRLTNSWVASISDSILQIKKLNIKDNKTSYYIERDEWQPLLVKAFEAAIRPASVEVEGGRLTPYQLKGRLDKNHLIEIAIDLLLLTYEYEEEDLPDGIDTHLIQLPGGEGWLEGK
ncbi:DUF29 family protein [Limnofasciculus baicalensis]|uniref:DUF29 domain-containing protein n=1 Tax=Limnofasciculus baicalensis BBK-W-15 TaxID=2699891 RepID=A0AAE3KKX3_9CYAN|nr:DUF29 family protein [Limnofasciculus baicalensis]MCP2727965.1 DUF29 domain-containing protein [Limnofasciculus baicalensis BBK-W-15]